MSPLVRRYIKTGFAFLAFGLLTGLHISAAEYLGWGTLRHGYIVAHTHMLLVGFVMMLIMGVALWMFPKPAEGDPRWKAGRFELIWWLVCIGVVFRSMGEIAREYWSPGFWGWVVFGASSLETLGMMLFCVGMLPRIRSPREELRRSGRG